MVNKATSAFLGVCGLVLDTESRESGALYVFTPVYKRRIHGFSVFHGRGFPSTGLRVTPEPRFGPGDTEQEQNPDRQSVRLLYHQLLQHKVRVSLQLMDQKTDMFPSGTTVVRAEHTHTPLLHQRLRKHSCSPENLLLLSVTSVRLHKARLFLPCCQVSAPIRVTLPCQFQIPFSSVTKGLEVTLQVGRNTGRAGCLSHSSLRPFVGGLLRETSRVNVFMKWSTFSSD